MNAAIAHGLRIVLEGDASSAAPNARPIHEERSGSDEMGCSFPLPSPFRLFFCEPTPEIFHAHARALGSRTSRTRGVAREGFPVGFRKLSRSHSRHQLRDFGFRHRLWISHILSDVYVVVKQI